MTNTSEEAAERLRKSSRSYRMMRSAFNFFSAWVRLAIPGTVVVMTPVLASKVLWPVLFYTAYALPLWLVGAAVYILWHTDQWKVSTTSADALVDYHSGKYGIYMAVQQSHNRQWQNDLGEKVTRPPIGFPVRATLKLLLLTICVIGVLVLPDLRPERKRSSGGINPLKRTEQLIDVLEEKKLAEQEKLQQARELVEKLKQDEEKGLDRDEWRALDESRQDLRRQVAKKMRKEGERYRKLEAALRKMEKGQALSREEREKLSKTLKNLSETKMQKAMKAASQKTGMSRKRLKSILKKCGRSGACLSKAEKKALSKLARAAKLTEGKGKKGKKALKTAGFSEEEIKAMMVKSGAGKGGVTRGPGSSEMQYLGDTEKKGGAYKAKTFKGHKDELKASLGWSVGNPDDENDGETTTTKSLKKDVKNSKEGLTWHARTLPRHNDALKNYFQD